MTDHELEQRLRSWYRAEVGEAERAPAALRASVAGIPHPRSVPAGRLPWGFSRTTSMRFAVAAVIGVLAVGGAFYALGPRVPADTGPSQSPGLNASPSATVHTSTWTSTGVMLNDGRFATATLLLDGRVLVAGGGYGSSGEGTFAELYDPASGSWAATGTMATPRVGHSATRLPDGKVLVAGGSPADASGGQMYGERVMGPALASAELYDPRSGAWTSTGPMIDARGIFTATPLRDGRVLVVGGATGLYGADQLASAELYEPASGTWAATGRMIAPRVGATAAVLADGRVLVAGGYGNCGAVTGCQQLDSAELYDPGTGSWSTTGPMTSARADSTATLLADGTVLVAGGLGYTNCKPAGCDHRQLASAELYDPGTGSWAAISNMLDGRVGHTATLLRDGKVLVAGGFDGAGPLRTAELYDPANGSWTATPDMRVSRVFFTATLLLDGRVLVAGDSKIALLYDPGSETPPPPTARVTAAPTLRAASWTATGKMITPREDHTATLLRDGKVLVAGGAAGVPGMGGTEIASAELYDPASGTWTAIGSMIDARAYHTATLLGDGRVLVAGGYCCYNPDAGAEALASAELYDPASGTWTATGSMLTPHGGGTATLLPDGKVLVSGGHGTSRVTTSAELYDPASGTWTATGSMLTPHGGGTATLLPDGRVLMAGGYGTSGQTRTAELYDPASGTWTATGSMVTPGSGPHTATLLPNGTVLVAGGFESPPPSGPCCAQPSGELPPGPSAELYDPASGTWTATGEMKEVRSNHTATLLPNGDVFVTGSGDGGPVSAELYDPATRSWTAISNSIEEHLYGETATLLPDGNVLVVGGSNGTNLPSGDAVMAGAELYDPGSGN
jgi:N-acetylneuraminic acid mutarotase